MTIPLTIRNGTTRNYPEDQDRDYAADATNWAVDVTAAVNASPASNETFRADAVVGTAAQVVAGEATHSDINTAIAAVSAGETILILNNTYSLSALVDIDKAILVIGQGPGATLQSDAGLAAGPLVQITASGGQIHNVTIAQGTGTPDYGVLIDAALTGVVVANVVTSGTFSTADISDGSSSLITSSELIRGQNMTLANPLPITSGGTGQATANAAFNALAPSQAAASGKYLKSDGTDASWDALDISTADITGTLPIANGGSGQTTANAALNAFLPSQAAASGKYLKSNGTDTAWDQIDISSADVTGTLPITSGGTGQTTANAALNALLPDQTGNSGKVLSTDATDTSWINVATDPTTTRGDLIRRGAAALERFAAVTDNRVVRGDGTDVVLGQIDDTGFFTSGAAATTAAYGVVTAGTVPGVADDSSATAGTIGEYVESRVEYTGNAATSGTAYNVGSLNLTAGDWDVGMGFGLQGTNASTVVAAVIAGISKTSATLPATTTYASAVNGEIRLRALIDFDVGTSSVSQTISPIRVSLAADDIIYGVMQPSFSNTANYFGGIWARRVR